MNRTLYNMAFDFKETLTSKGIASEFKEDKNDIRISIKLKPFYGVKSYFSTLFSDETSLESHSNSIYFLYDFINLTNLELKEGRSDFWKIFKLDKLLCEDINKIINDYNDYNHYFYRAYTSNRNLKIVTCPFEDNVYPYKKTISSDTLIENMIECARFIDSIFKMVLKNRHLV